MNKDKTILKIKFEENLSDFSIKMIENILNNSLRFKTTIEEIHFKPNYEKGFNILMDYFDNIPTEEKEEVSKKLKEIGL